MFDRKYKESKLKFYPIYKPSLAYFTCLLCSIQTCKTSDGSTDVKWFSSLVVNAIKYFVAIALPVG